MPTSLPATGAHGAGLTSSPQIGGPTASGNAGLSGPSVVGAGSFPRSLLIPGTDTSIRIGGSEIHRPDGGLAANVIFFGRL
jgi:hypothetical protein